MMDRFSPSNPPVDQMVINFTLFQHTGSQRITSHRYPLAAPRRDGPHTNFKMPNDAAFKRQTPPAGSATRLMSTCQNNYRNNVTEAGQAEDWQQQRGDEPKSDKADRRHNKPIRGPQQANLIKGGNEPRRRDFGVVVSATRPESKNEGQSFPVRGDKSFLHTKPGESQA